MRTLGDGTLRMTPPLCWGLAGSAVLLLFLVPRPAFADGLSDAKDLFVQGRDLRGHGDCAGAIALFRKAYDLYPAGLGTLRNIAECQESLGQFASARRTWLDLKRDLLTNTSPRYDGWARDADQAAARLTPKLATIKIDLSVVRTNGEPAPADGVEVTLNGEPIATGLAGTPLERDPGHYVVRVAGRRVSAAEQQTVDLREGEAKSMALRVVLAEAPRPSDAPPGPAPVGAVSSSDKDSHDDSLRRTAAWIAIGAGAASLVTVGISVGVWAVANDDVGNGCPTHTGCSPSLIPAYDRGRTASTLVNVFLPIGLVGVAGGVVLLTTSPRHDAPAAVAVSPTGVWAFGRF
jgi:hypothetical protein